MSEFTFLYRGGERAGSPEETQVIMGKWMAWMKDLGAKGHLVNVGNPLEDSGRMVTGRDKTITDGPYAEKDLVCGFTIIKADDLDHAAELSKGCPIFEQGGHVEVRPIMPMNM